MTLTVRPARWQKKGRLSRPRLIVIHCTVSPEVGNGAENVANYFATTDRPGSTHLVWDNNSTVRCVNDEDTCYGAAGANHDGLHGELVGMPDQTEAQWLDAYSIAELHQAGPYIREWSRKYQIPLRWLTIAEVADGVTRGLCTHHDVSRAFPKVSTGHWDPGPNFPKTRALQIWQGTPTIPEPEDDMYDPTLDQEIKQDLVNRPQGGMFVWGSGGNLNGIGVTAGGLCVQVWYVDGQLHKRLLATDVVAVFAGPRVVGQRCDVQIERQDGSIRWLTFDPGRAGFPGRGDLPPGYHLVPDAGGYAPAGGWHYVDI